MRGRRFSLANFHNAIRETKTILDAAKKLDISMKFFDTYLKRMGVFYYTEQESEDYQSMWCVFNYTYLKNHSKEYFCELLGVDFINRKINVSRACKLGDLNENFPGMIEYAICYLRNKKTVISYLGVEETMFDSYLEKYAGKGFNNYKNILREEMESEIESEKEGDSELENEKEDGSALVSEKEVGSEWVSEIERESKAAKDFFNDAVEPSVIQEMSKKRKRDQTDLTHKDAGLKRPRLGEAVKAGAGIFGVFNRKLGQERDYVFHSWEAKSNDVSANRKHS